MSVTTFSTLGLTACWGASSVYAATGTDVWVEVIDAVFGPLLIAVLAGVGWLIRDYLRAIMADTSATVEHVVNSHAATNLRDDIDGITAAVAGLRESMKELRAELHAERLERAESDRRIEREFEGGAS